jgi:feruloyl esterase
MRSFCAVLLPILPAALTLLSSPVSAANASCESMARAVLPNTRIDTAASVRAGNLSVPNDQGRTQTYNDLPALCRVTATLRPSSDSDIKVEVWLPANWNGKFQAVGNGVWLGSINYNLLSAAVRAGYAAASTDTGHRGNTASFALGHPEKLVDYSYRSHHEMTLKAKALIRSFYGEAPRQSYFNGCSSGGRQALKEATLYPNEFDGLVVGDPANLRAERNVWQLAAITEIQKNKGGSLSIPDVNLIHDNVLKACDALDGVRDRLIENPKLCKFDVGSLTCKAGQTNACLSAPKVRSARMLLSPGKTKNGEQYQPGLELGSETGAYGARLPGWAVWGAEDPGDPAPADNFRYLTYKNPNWDWRTFNADEALPLTRQANKIETAYAADLAKFLQGGGKIVFYHGWADPSVAAQATIDYFDDVKKLPKGPESARLFMVPGMGHCSGGDGATDKFDAVAALDTWVTGGRAPQQIVARHEENGRTTRTRPLCPYRQVAAYKGTGSTDDAANFMCKTP